jgi:hypothetical protein
MRWPLGLSPAYFADWFDLQRRDRRDAIVILSIAALVYLASDFYELPLKLFQFGTDHADWDVDDMILVVFVLGLALIVYGLRRYQDISREINARIAQSWRRSIWQGTTP